MPTVRELADYLQWFLEHEPDTQVVLSADDWQGEGEFLALDVALSDMPREADEPNDDQYEDPQAERLAQEDAFLEAEYENRVSLGPDQ